MNFAPPQAKSAIELLLAQLREGSPMPSCPLPGGLRTAWLSVAATLAFALAGCDKKAAAAPAMPPPEVSVVTVEPTTLRQWDEFTGRIAATDTVDVRPRVSGYVQRVAFKEGDEVKAGDLLVVIDQRPYRAALETANAQLERARAVAQLAQTEERRAQVLVERNAIAPAELDTRRAGSNQATADVHAGQAAVETANLNLSFTEVRAPISGRLSRATMTVGNLAQADQSVLTSMVSIDPVYVYFQPDEQAYLRYAALVRSGARERNGSPVRLGLANEEGFPHEGIVNFVDNQVAPGTGTINARAVVPNADRAFTPGLFARVKLEASGESSAIQIDDKAVLTDQDRKYVYVVGAENTATRRYIVVGSLVDGKRVVRSGLVAGDKVIVNGVQKVFAPGMPVKPVPLLASAETPTTPSERGSAIGSAP
jgi:multidrug efflux system membrane fusion protein